jgi:endonuclease YncB( thermonuclease family)
VALQPFNGPVSVLNMTSGDGANPSGESNMNWRLWHILPMTIGLVATTVAAKDIAPADIGVVTGDTIVAHGETYRLVGFDTPGTVQAQCPSERKLGYRATFRLRRIVAEGGLDLEPVSCKESHACAILRAHGQNVAELMVATGVARPFTCSTATCPPHTGWCAGATHG